MQHCLIKNQMPVLSIYEVAVGRKMSLQTERNLQQNWGHEGCPSALTGWWMGMGGGRCGLVGGGYLYSFKAMFVWFEYLVLAQSCENIQDYLDINKIMKL